jgi:PAS domain S-box-containing protein
MPEGRAIACLVVASRTQDRVSLSARHALETIAARLGSVIARLEAEEALRESEEKFNTFVCHSPYGYVELDLEGNLLFTNQRAADIFGYSAEEALGYHFTRFIDESDIPRAAANLQLVGEGVDVGPIDYMGRAKDGSSRFVQITTVPLTKRGRKIGFQVAMLDVTARKQAEQALREHDAKLRSLFENLPDMVLMVDGDAAIQFANRGLPGAPLETLVGASGLRFVAPEHQPAVGQCLQQALATRQVQAVEVLDIFGFCWASRVVPMLQDGQSPCAMIICTDVTQQKKAAEAVQKEQQLLRQLLDLHERDRRVIAYEIHDGFAQQLTAAMYNFEAFDRLQSQQPERARNTFDTALSLLGRSIAECRRLISGLRPPILDEFGIVAAVEYLICESREQGDAEIAFEHDVRFGRLAPPLESAIFRIVQESLANASRHSQSQKVRVELRQRGDRVLIDVRDWGIGFEPGGVQEGRFGLQGIRERVRLLGGQVAIVTAPQQGTHISVELPVIERPAESCAEF